MQDKPELKIDWASHEAAKYACENWHYSKVIPVGKLVKVGAWEGGKFIGCVIFGRGANNNMLKPFGLNADEGCELVRISLRKHETPVSKILSFALKFLKKQSPELRLVVSYADADQNHHGGIYQATNWIYDGLKNANTMGAFIINGKKTHPKSVHSKGIKQTIVAVKKHLDPNATIFYTKGKHRYLMPLDKEMGAKIAPLAKPYPKREKQAMVDSLDTAAVRHRPSRSILIEELSEI
jgi:hypothetical protein